MKGVIDEQATDTGLVGSRGACLGVRRSRERAGGGERRGPGSSRSITPRPRALGLRGNGTRNPVQELGAVVGVRRDRGARRLGERFGHWLGAQGSPSPVTPRDQREVLMTPTCRSCTA